MEDGDIDIPPFWQPPATITRRGHGRRPSSSRLLNSSLLIILLPSISLLFVVFIVIPSIPKILPHYINKPINPPQNQKAISVKKSWDTVNIILVLFAILCGVFAKRNDDSPATTEREETRNHEQPLTHSTTTTNSNISSSSVNTVLLQRSKTMMSSVPQWVEYSSQQQRIISSPNAPPDTGISRLRRTVSSDPYMRYQTGNSQFRFFDDLDISKFYPKEDRVLNDELQSDEVAAAVVEVEEVDDVETSTVKVKVKDIEVDTFATENRGELPSPTFSPPKTPPRNPPEAPPPPPPPPPAKQRRTFQTIQQRGQIPPSPPPPTPPPLPRRGREEKKRSSRKRNATKEIATAIVYLYSHRKRKRRQKLSRNFEGPSHSEIQSHFVPPPSPPPPPPPLPPHPSVFQNWFKKGSKTKKIHSFSSIPTPPPPPTRQNPVNSARKPPLPSRRESGNESPMNGIPTPPPPPFKVSQMKFKPMEDGYVRVQSAQSSRCGSPEIDGADDDTLSSSSNMNGQDVERLSSMTCPSPDLNVKVASFIARHHDGWRLEKLNSWREKLNKAGDGPISRPTF
ncbi:hypothetical protein SOVF_151850 [Spinacia oleracea]|uniref:Uncharacterized protein n=1 Tax=Spinacia oleracea TaxID=3562 RepID=A0A9R0JBW6_SPIOL|nr:uncharacterized protein LOC110803173 [Spinacia oleracea]KNA09606.1 hypothetical protein SOVF_151850 [Spinacia oleracea]